MEEFSLLDPVGQEWLENHLLEKWPLDVENTINRQWQQWESRLIQCHPEQAFLLLLRKYLLGDMQELEQRLRKLLLTLAKFGENSRMIAALSLLGLVTIEQNGVDPEVCAICFQIEKETLAYGTLEYILRLFLYAQKAVIKGEQDEANQYYNELLKGKLNTYSLTAIALGRVYEKLVCYINRQKKQPLKAQWLLATKQWISQFPMAIVSANLQSILKQEKENYINATHPIYVWNRYKTIHATDQDLMPVKSDNFVQDQEIRIILALIQAFREKTHEAIEQANYIANLYGDPYWQEQVQLVSEKNKKMFKEVIEEDRNSLTSDLSILVLSPSYRFTFFESFQGIAADGNRLFPQRYKRKKVKQLLALMMLQPRYQIVKDVLVEKLLGENDKDKNCNYLHVLIHRLRELFYAQTNIQDGWIWIQNNMVFFNEERVSGVDVQEYLKISSVGHQLWFDDQVAALELYQKAARMFQLVIAPEFEYEDWLTVLRTDLIVHQQKILRRLLHHASTNGLFEQAIHYCEQLLEIDEWDLSAVSCLCKQLEKSGAHSKLYEICSHYEQILKADQEECPDWLVTYKFKSKPDKKSISVPGMKLP